MPDFIADISCRCPDDPYMPAQAARYECGSLDGVGEVILLVHGYNDHEKYADCAYQQFHDICTSSSVTTFKLPFARLQWPGDEANAITGAVEYARALNHAKQSAAALAPLLARWAATVPSGARLHLIAHSLGNRVALETICQLQVANSAIQVATLGMLAAAVEVDHVSPGGMLNSASVAADRSIVLHSTSDLVLHWLFSPGQFTAGEGFLKEAVGRYGNPQGQWSAHQAFNSFGHSNYWFDPGAVDYLLGQMGIPTNRLTPENTAPSGPMPPPNATPVASTPSRQTPSWDWPYTSGGKFQNPCPG